MHEDRTANGGRKDKAEIGKIIGYYPYTIQT
jgi:hypothetical protein